MVDIQRCKVHLTESSSDQLGQRRRKMSLERKEIKSGAIYISCSSICIDYISSELIIGTIFIFINRARCNRYVSGHLAEFVLDF
jgi:hypothetical protein